MQTLFKNYKVTAIMALVCGWMLAVGADWTSADSPPMFPPRVGVVAFDPGHGGKDSGAHGPMGMTEKTVTLNLARQLALAMEPDFGVILTRSDDYHVDLDQRAAIANSTKAEVMVSLHTGAGFRHTSNGRTIYYHAGNAHQTDKEGIRTAGNQPRWHRVQSRHVKTSMDLAETIKRQLDRLADNIPCHIQAAPLVVLQGADMPAVLVEVGHITHPNTEKNMANSQGLDRLAKAISAGIRDYIE